MFGRAVAGKALIGGALVLLGLPVASQQGPPAEGHREDPVAAPESPVTRESQQRSPRAVVARGLIQSIQVNVDAQQNNIVADAANEPSIAIDPTDPNNIVIGWRQFDTIASDFRQAGVAYSHDGGATWTFPGSLDPGQFRSDPVLAADSVGNFYYYSLSSVTTTEYFVSIDKGVNWSAPTFSPGGDKNWQTIDVTGGSGDGHIYPIWNSQFSCCGPGTDFSRSTDSAASFEGPYVLPSHPKWGTNDVGPDGELYIVGTNLNGVGHVILRSDDARDGLVAPPSFGLARSIDLGGITGTGGLPNPAGLLGQVWVAVDRSGGPTRGNVYVLGSVNPPGSDPADVHFIRSDDGGLTWSAPLRVNDDAVGSDAHQWFGTMSVSPEGRIDVVWNDTRAGSATMSELYYAYSTDGGTTFSAGLAVSPVFNSTVGHPIQAKIGDYYDMVSESDTAALAYAATFNGEQDVYFARLGDCNANGTHDSVDLSTMASADIDANGIPDECQPDCNGNGVPDSSDISSGTSQDCNGNNIPDECDIASGSSDCDGDGVPDECSVTFDLETPQGFTAGVVGDTATAGVWIRVDPVGSVAQPEDDHTLFPGTTCFVTGQASAAGIDPDSHDVDGGKTTLLTPALDLSGLADPSIGYWRWFSNDTGSAPGTDTLRVDISGDLGQSWRKAETVGPTGPEASGGWFFHSLRVSDFVTPSANVMLRFVASDLGSDSRVEAAVDDLVVTDCAACALSVPGEVADLRLSLSATVATLSWDTVPDAATYDVYRGTQRDASDLACFVSGVVGNSTVDDGLVPAPGEALFYVATAVNCAGESTLGSGRIAAAACP